LAVVEVEVVAEEATKLLALPLNHPMAVAKLLEAMEVAKLLEEVVVAMVLHLHKFLEAVAHANLDHPAHLVNLANLEDLDKMDHQEDLDKMELQPSPNVHKPQHANQAAIPDPLDHLDLVDHLVNPETLANLDPHPMPTLKQDLQAHLDHPEDQDNLAVPANLDNPEHPDKSSNLMADKVHLDLLAHPVNLVDLDSLVNLLNLNLDHQAHLETKDHPAHLVHPEIPEVLAMMEYLVALVLAITAHHHVLLQDIKIIKFFLPHNFLCYMSFIV